MIYLTYLTGKIEDGGISRNYCFYQYFTKNGVLVKQLYATNNLFKIFNLISLCILLKIKKNTTIIFHLNTIFLIFIKRFLEKKAYRNFALGLIKTASKKNKLLIEINDLNYEQALDLEIPCEKWWQEIEGDIYSLSNTKYIFASNIMRDYIVEKYNVSKEKTSVVINGGPKLEIEFLEKGKKFLEKNNKIKFIYAGGLNKGRQIERMINLFSKNNNIELYLIGMEGEWIKKEDYPKNIYYLGSFEEKIAHAIAANCDVGLIPYDENRFYYNLCYPTKASFYITAGIPILSTNLKELKDVLLDEEIAWFESFENWEKILKIFDKKMIRVKKNNLEKIKNEFLWENLIKLKI